MANGPAAPREGRLVSGTTFESVFKGLGAHLTEPVAVSLASIGLDHRKTLALWYPESTWLKMIEVVTAGVYAQLSPDDARRQLGEQIFAGFLQTIPGAVVGVLLKLLGPKRTLLRTCANLRNGNNYAVIQIVEKAPCTYELSSNTSFDSQWVTAGLIGASLRAAGAKNLTFVPIDRQPQLVIYRVAWDA